MKAAKKRLAPLSPKAVRQVVMHHLRDLNTPRSLAIYLIMRNTDEQGGTDDEITTLKVDPLWFNSADAYFEFSEPTDLVRKSTILKLSVNPTDVAASRFLEAEEICESTNRRLKLCSDPTGRLGQLVDQVRKNIASLLPEVTSVLLDSFIEEGGWGGGSTSSCKGSRVDFCTKLGSPQHATSPLLPIARSLEKTIRGFGTVSVQDHNVVAFVPKDSRTDRAIAVEPSANLYLQRAVGTLIRRKLTRWGVNLQDQSWNQHLAMLGSVDGSYATVDLTMASDTIARKLIPYLFTDQSWVSLLSLLRSPRWIGGRGSPLEGQSGVYQKWSSMGNGYTFELESLIFSACAKAVTPRGELWAVYGDDIVVPAAAYEDLASLLEFLGFIPNKTKSFTTSQFRESCGADWFNGVAVRGFYIKDVKANLPFVYGNWLRQKHTRRPLMKAWRLLVSMVPKDLRCFSPIPSDGAFWVDGWEGLRDPLNIRELLLKGFRGVGWFEWVWRPVSRPLSGETSDAAIATFCRVVVADDPVDRDPVQLSERDRGRWVRRRQFLIGGRFGPQTGSAWPRG